VNLCEIVVYISHYLWKQKTRSTLGVDHENFNKFLLFIFNVSISERYAPTYTRKKYEANKTHCNMHTLKRNWAYNHKTQDYRGIQIIVNFIIWIFLVQCKHRHMLSIYCRDAAIDYLIAVETRKLRPLFTILSRLHIFVSRSKMGANLIQVESTNWLFQLAW
jgi:hypothetical protein